jgi:hypothetical protein
MRGIALAPNALPAQSAVAVLRDAGNAVDARANGGMSGARVASRRLMLRGRNKRAVYYIASCGIRRPRNVMNAATQRELDARMAQLGLEERAKQEKRSAPPAEHRALELHTPIPLAADVYWRIAFTREFEATLERVTGMQIVEARADTETTASGTRTSRAVDVLVRLPYYGYLRLFGVPVEGAARSIGEPPPVSVMLRIEMQKHVEWRTLTFEITSPLPGRLAESTFRGSVEVEATTATATACTQCTRIDAALRPPRIASEWTLVESYATRLFATFTEVAAHCVAQLSRDAVPGPI